MYLLPCYFHLLFKDFWSCAESAKGIYMHLIAPPPFFFSLNELFSLALCKLTAVCQAVGKRRREIEGVTKTESERSGLGHYHPYYSSLKYTHHKDILLSVCVCCARGPTCAPARRRDRAYTRARSFLALLMCTCAFVCKSDKKRTI